MTMCAQAELWESSANGVGTPATPEAAAAEFGLGAHADEMGVQLRQLP